MSGMWAEARKHEKKIRGIVTGLSILGILKKLVFDITSRILRILMEHIVKICELRPELQIQNYKF